MNGRIILKSKIKPDELKWKKKHLKTLKINISRLVTIQTWMVDRIIWKSKIKPDELKWNISKDQNEYNFTQ